MTGLVWGQGLSWRLPGSHKRRKVPGLEALWELRGNYRSLLGGSRASRSGLGPGTESGASFGAFFGACGVAEPAKACRGRRRSSWSPLATIGVSWEALGHLGVVLGGFLVRRGLRDSRRLDSLRTLLEASWRCLRRFPGALPGPLWSPPRRCRGPLGASWGHLGGLGPSRSSLWALLGGIWGPVGAVFGVT